MLASLRWFTTAALLAGCLTVVPSALATKASGRAFAVEDGAKLFGADALERANEKIEKIKRDYDKDLLIVTLKSVPEADRDKVKNKDDRSAYFDRYAHKQYERHGVKGIYVLISDDPKWAEVISGKKTEKKAFTPADRRAARKVLVDNLKEDPDKALTALVDEVDKTLQRNGVKASSDSGRSKVSTTGGSRTSSGGSGIWGWVCIGVVVLLGVWLVIGLVRAFTSGGGGGGGGPGGGYGGGGFMTSMLGGLFGAAAGMYLYDSFFRSNMPTDYGGSAYGNSPPAGDDTAAGGGAGGDWGDDNAAGGGGGGDAGGDWGGGGDAGGGDWGGGGGDGGDW